MSARRALLALGLLGALASVADVGRSRHRKAVIQRSRAEAKRRRHANHRRKLALASKRKNRWRS